MKECFVKKNNGLGGIGCIYVGRESGNFGGSWSICKNKEAVRIYERYKSRIEPGIKKGHWNYKNPNRAILNEDMSCPYAKIKNYEKEWEEKKRAKLLAEMKIKNKWLPYYQDKEWWQ